MGGMASAAGEDVKIGLGLKDDPERGRPQYRGGDGLTDYQRRTKATVEREKKRNAASGESTSPAQAAAAQLAEANRNLAVRGSAMSAAAAPALPNADAVGETEQALLDANKTGRSSTIATSAAGLLAGEDSTRKKRSLMGGLIR